MTHKRYVMFYTTERKEPNKTARCQCGDAHLPSSRFSTIDVRDPTVAGHRLSSKRKLPMVDTQFVGCIPSEVVEGQIQLCLRFRCTPVRVPLGPASCRYGSPFPRLGAETPLYPKNANGGAENRVVLLTRKHLRINGFSPGRSIAERWD
jgi:hypothetical protein